MKHVTILFAALFATAPAMADGFVCSTEDGLNVKVYNNTDAEVGTRVAAVMVLSDENISVGSKTIAVFRDSTGLLNSTGSSFEAKVDLRHLDSKRKGENIGGTKLGQLDTIVVDVDYAYNAPVIAGTELTGTLTLTKRNGEVLEHDLNCARYLKN